MKKKPETKTLIKSYNVATNAFMLQKYLSIYVCMLYVCKYFKHTMNQIYTYICMKRNTLQEIIGILKFYLHLMYDLPITKKSLKLHCSTKLHIPRIPQSIFY